MTGRRRGWRNGESPGRRRKTEPGCGLLASTHRRSVVLAPLFKVRASGAQVIGSLCTSAGQLRLFQATRWTDSQALWISGVVQTREGAHAKHAPPEVTSSGPALASPTSQLSNLSVPTQNADCMWGRLFTFSEHCFLHLKNEEFRLNYLYTSSTDIS